MIIFLTEPPEFLFDADLDTVVDFAGVVLWFHVAMSYAINSPAVYTTMDDWSLSAHTSTATTSIATTPGGSRPVVVLDQLFFVTGSFYLVANAIRVFKALVGLIGA